MNRGFFGGSNAWWKRKTVELMTTKRRSDQCLRPRVQATRCHRYSSHPSQPRRERYAPLAREGARERPFMLQPSTSRSTAPRCVYSLRKRGVGQAVRAALGQPPRTRPGEGQRARDRMRLCGWVTRRPTSDLQPRGIARALRLCEGRTHSRRLRRHWWIEHTRHALYAAAADGGFYGSNRVRILRTSLR